MRKFRNIIASVIAMITVTSAIGYSPVSAAEPAINVQPIIEVYVNGVLQPSIFFPEVNSTWNFGSGGWGQCYRWADNDEAHMRCKTATSSYPRVTYQTVTTWYDSTYRTNRTVWGSVQSVDGSSWGPWSDGFPNGGRTTLVKSSYYITW